MDFNFFPLIIRKMGRDIVPRDGSVSWDVKILDATRFTLMGVVFDTAMYLLLVFD